MGADKTNQPLLLDITQPTKFLASSGRVQEPTTQDKVIAILWLIVGIPLLLLAAPISVAHFYYQKFTAKPEKKVDPAVKFPVFKPDGKVDCAKRKYDLVMFGATGFTGSLCVDYLIKQYGISSFKWAIAGRNKAGLEKVLKEHVTANIADQAEQKNSTTRSTLSLQIPATLNNCAPW